ncbi:hypothetical protein LTR62_004261 [Meristemomyces frigidus]|uniref:Uncharacterized protein n=1 Tax=Meristemomyces frigidus TaxID=1508187 RepID=A0AAN7THT5_9PEZI|nr:hypothetical protein LTR62_004261 [Meristemomyces frigidus]
MEVQNVQRFFVQNLHNRSVIANISNSDCIAAYGTPWVAQYNHVLLITNQRGNAPSYTVFWDTTVTYDIGNGGGIPPYGWICEDQPNYRAHFECDVAATRKNALDWTVNESPIEYCLASITPPHCKLQFSLQILITVIVMNAAKSICMFLTLHRQRESTPVTIGDAMSSFLDRPDELTKGRCLMAKVDVFKGPLRWRLPVTRHNSKSLPGWSNSGAAGQPHTKPAAITYYAPLARRWFAGASVMRWVVTMGLCLLALITGGSLLGAGSSAITSYLSGGTVFSLGFGAIDSRALLSVGLPQGGTGGLVTAVLLANLPQAIVSFLYLTYNGLLTSMLLCHEYSKYALEGRRKPLRVTTPHGQQRSTYYLNLPYTYSLPLLIASGTLHWLISESIFLARLSVYSNTNDANIAATSADAEEYSEVGYSCLPILLAILLGTAMLLFALGLGLRKFASAIPVAGSCSVALAAAAHRPVGDTDAAYLPVWGEVDGEGNEEVGHCCFTSEEVHELVPGRAYAGAREDLGEGARVRCRDGLSSAIVID